MAVSLVLLPFLFLLAVVILAIPVVIGVYVYRDAKARGMEALVWALIAVLAPGFVGLIIYLVARRDHVKLCCPQCGEEVGENYATCPRCGQKLAASCLSCGTPLKADWKLCPRCGTEITEAEPFIPPVVASGASGKGLTSVIIVMLMVPVLVVVMTVIGVADYSANTVRYEGGDYADPDFAIERLEEMREEDDRCGVFTLQDANVEKEVSDWAAEKAKAEKPGLYAKTFLESDQGVLYGRQGECDYSLFYGVTVVVLRPENGASYALTDGSRYVVPAEDNPLLGDGHEIELTELSALPKEQQKEAAAGAKAYGNVFVIRYPMSYEVTFNNRKDTTTVSAQSLDGESMKVTFKTKDSTADTLVPLDPDLEEFFDYMA